MTKSYRRKGYLRNRTLTLLLERLFGRSRTGTVKTGRPIAKPKSPAPLQR
jgi:hypothetical protein